MGPQLPEARVASWDGEPVVTRTGEGWRAELKLLPPNERPERVLKIKDDELRLLTELVDGDPVTVELARAIVTAAGSAHDKA